MPSGIYTRTEKHNLINVGRKYINRKRPEKKGLTPINKICLQCNKDFVTNCVMPNKKFCSLSCSSQSRPEMNLANLEKRGKEKQRLSVSSRIGELHQNWKGGTSKAYKTGYYSTEYKNWRKSVFERDNFTCQECSSTGFITAHHIKSFAHYPGLRFELSNGLTLCETCHSKTDNYKGRNKNQKLKSL